MTTKQPVNVVKIGGTQGVDFSAICQDAASLLSQGKRLVLVHGGSAEANQLGEALDYPPRFITSPSGYTSRYTDRRTLEIFIMAVNGKINTSIVEQLQALGVNALGLSGPDGRLMLATRKSAIQNRVREQRAFEYLAGRRLHPGDRAPGTQQRRGSPERRR